MSGLPADALRVLRDWPAPDPAQEQLRRAYVAHLELHPDGVWRHCLPAHLTASTLVVDPAGERVLLNHHAKGGFWGQFGGHCEPGDETLAAAALREAVEESGVADLRLLSEQPVDLDRHLLSAAFGGCGEHLDVRYAAVATADAAFGASGESHDVRWFDLSDLPGEAVRDLPRLIAAARRLAHGSASGGRSSPAAAETPSR